MKDSLHLQNNLSNYVLFEVICLVAKTIANSLQLLEIRVQD